MAINQYQPTRTGVQGISDALSAVAQIYGIKQASAAKDLLDQHIASGKAEAALMAEQRDPNTQVSKKAQIEASSLYDYALKKGIGDPEKISSLKQMISGDEKTPGMSAYDISNDRNTSALLDLVKGQQAADTMAIRILPQVNKLQETKNQNSIDAGNDFEKDQIISLSKTNLNALKRSQSILSNPNKPVLTKDLNLAYNDYINAVAAGGAATEGKINRELPETYAGQLNELKSRFGDNEDLRKDPVGAQMVNLLNQNIGTVRNDMTKAISDQAGNKYENYAQTTNTQVSKIAKQKLKTYAPDKYATLFGGEKPAPTQQSGAPNPSPNDSGQDPDALKYSQMHNIPYEQAAPIIQQRKAALSAK